MFFARLTASFTSDGVAIRLWANERQDPNWGYPKFRDTRSRDYLIAGNQFANVNREVDITRTANVRQPAADDPAARATDMTADQRSFIASQRSVNASAMNCPASPGAPTATRMYCLPPAM